MESPEQMMDRLERVFKDKYGLELTAMERYAFIKEITKRDQAILKGEGK